MRSLWLLCTLVAAGLFAVEPTSAKDMGDISPSTLRAMGLEQMPVVSDARGHAIRGKGVIVVGGAFGVSPTTRAAAFAFVFANPTPAVVDVQNTVPPTPRSVNVNVLVRVNFPNFPTLRR